MIIAENLRKCSFCLSKSTSSLNWITQPTLQLSISSCTELTISQSPPDEYLDANAYNSWIKLPYLAMVRIVSPSVLLQHSVCKRHNLHYCFISLITNLLVFAPTAWLSNIHKYETKQPLWHCCSSTRIGRQTPHRLRFPTFQNRLNLSYPIKKL
jgi:hypothetical protein